MAGFNAILGRFFLGLAFLPYAFCKSFVRALISSANRQTKTHTHYRFVRKEDSSAMKMYRIYERTITLG